MDIPLELKKYLSRAKSILSTKGVGDVLFSEGTYEIEVKEGKNSFFPFIQIKDSGKIQDSFCSCAQQEKEGHCVHIAAGYLKIFEKGQEPLHLRFRNSFWKVFWEAIAVKSSYDLKKFSLSPKEGKGADRYTLSISGKDESTLEVSSAFLKKKIRDIYNSDIEKVEDSIKFSSLSFEDMSLFKKGRIRHELEFELSSFSDLAKELFFMQEAGKTYEINFLPIDDTLPTIATLSCDGIKIEMQLTEEDWKLLIPSLNTVKSPLELYDFEKDAIENVIYDREVVSFYIEVRKEIIDEINTLREEKKTSVGEWLFIPKKGFLSKTRSLFFEKRIVEKEEIPETLDSHRSLFEKHLKNEKIHYEPHPAKYYLFIDGKNALHLCPYLFEKEELLKKESHFFGPWAYIEGRGFFLLENLIFNSSEKIVFPDKVAEFVSHYRTWLQNIDGFQTHFGNFQEEYFFYLTENKDLKFETRIKLPQGFEKSIDFGNWIYIETRGFFSKKEQAVYPIRPNTFIKFESIDDYIIANEEDLHQIPGFFTEDNPLKHFGLKIKLNDQGRIEITPEKILEEGIGGEDLTFFSNFVYVKKRGFFKLPFNFKIPAEYGERKEILHSNESFFIEYELKRLKPFILSIDDCLAWPESLKIKLETIKKDKNSYLAELYYVSEMGAMAASDLLPKMQNKRRFIFTPAGILDSYEPRFSWLKEIPLKRVLSAKKMIRMTFLQWLKLSVLEEVKKPRGKSYHAVKTAKIFEELKNLETDIPMDLSSLRATLRPYQEAGVKWLWFLYCFGLSGLLCDEMGLGKTHQAMALVAAANSMNKNKKYLVICPTSVIYHWEELLKRFLPEFKVCLFHGVERELEADFDILLTSYGLARSENKKISMMKFEVAIYDEAQVAKNYLSKTYKALKKIRSKMIIGLSGTPIENRIRELKSLFDLVLPGYLPSEAKFQEFFVTPIEKENDSERKKMLTKLIKPFILRRKKQEVLLDLPEKIEEVLYCDLLEDQKELYYETAFLSKKEVLEGLNDKAKPVKYIHVFSILSKLKQICDHPVLVNKDIKNYKKYKSGKWELFKELLDEVLESDQKVVIFTQYLDMIKIIGDHLNEKGVMYASITGSTKDRKEQIVKFKEEPKCNVFIASLLAAGVGIDLSCASIVIHYDRWWNPAKENQATDRVHRIGQNRGVQVLKLLTKNTIEERIHELIEKKKGLIEETIGKDESDQIKTLSRNELITIFQELKTADQE